MTPEQFDARLDARDRRLGLIDEAGRPTTATPPKVEKNGNRWVPVVGLALTILTMVTLFTLWTFKTNASADLEHERIDGKMKLQRQTQRSLIIEQARQGRNIVTIGEKVGATGLEPPQIQIPPAPDED